VTLRIEQQSDEVVFEGAGGQAGFFRSGVLFSRALAEMHAEIRDETAEGLAGGGAHVETGRENQRRLNPAEQELLQFLHHVLAAKLEKQDFKMFRSLNLDRLHGRLQEGEAGAHRDSLALDAVFQLTRDGKDDGVGILGQPRVHGHGAGGMYARHAGARTLRPGDSGRERSAGPAQFAAVRNRRGREQRRCLIDIGNFKNGPIFKKLLPRLIERA